MYAFKHGCRALVLKARLGDEISIFLTADRVIVYSMRIKFMRFQDFYEMFLMRVPLGVISETRFLGWLI